MEPPSTRMSSTSAITHASLNGLRSACPRLRQLLERPGFGELVAELVPAARQGLVKAGVAAAEAEGLLEVISARAACGQNGATWQRAMLVAASRRHERELALAIMLDRYLQCADTWLPVHTWPVAS